MRVILADFFFIILEWLVAVGKWWNNNKSAARKLCTKMLNSFRSRRLFSEKLTHFMIKIKLWRENTFEKKNWTIGNRLFGRRQQIALRIRSHSIFFCCSDT